MARSFDRLVEIGVAANRSGEIVDSLESRRLRLRFDRRSFGRAAVARALGLARRGSGRWRRGFRSGSDRMRRRGGARAIGAAGRELRLYIQQRRRRWSGWGGGFGMRAHEPGRGLIPSVYRGALCRGRGSGRRGGGRSDRGRGRGIARPMASVARRFRLGVELAIPIALTGMMLPFAFPFPVASRFLFG